MRASSETERATLKQLVLAALAQKALKLEGDIEVVFDGDLPRPVTMMIDSTPDCTASSTTYWMSGLSTSGSISFGEAFVAGRKRVPRPAAGNTALRIF